MSVPSHRPRNFLNVALVGLLCLGMLVACGRTRPTQSPPVPGGPPPAVESSTYQAQHMLTIEQTQSIRRIHEGLFQEAQQYFETRDFQQAIRELTRLLALHPKGSLEKEGRWLLGQS